MKRPLAVVAVAFGFLLTAVAVAPAETMTGAKLMKLVREKNNSKTQVSQVSMKLVDKKGRIAMGARLVAREQLPDVIRDTLTANPEALIQLKPDTQTDATVVIGVMEAIRAGGAEYIVLMTIQRSGGGV